MKENDHLIKHLAYNSYIPGLDRDDLIQEMRIKTWKIIRDGKYDPVRCKPTSYFYRVYKNTIIDLHRKSISKSNEVNLNPPLLPIDGYNDDEIEFSVEPTVKMLLDGRLSDEDILVEMVKRLQDKGLL